MPEVIEADAAEEEVDHFIQNEPEENRQVVNLWCDATKAEQTKAPRKSSRAQGHVYVMESDSKIQRGQRHTQVPLFPPQFANSPIPIAERGLVLLGTAPSPRNVILNLGVLWLQVQLFLHTVPMIYRLEDWYEGICKVSSKKRGFRVGLALEFRKHVLAFVTLDGIIAAHWKPTRDELPGQHLDIVNDWPKWLAAVVDWIRKRRAMKSNREGPASQAVKDASTVFGGVGLYTSAEVFDLSGFEPDVTEAEVFDHPSRTARLCAACYHFVADARENVWPMMKQFLKRDYMLTVTREDRTWYSERRLRVWGKQRVFMTQRRYELLKEYENLMTTLHTTWLGQHGAHDPKAIVLSTEPLSDNEAIEGKCATQSSRTKEDHALEWEGDQPIAEDDQSDEEDSDSDSEPGDDGDADAAVDDALSDTAQGDGSAQKWLRSSALKIYDPFEPLLIRRALTMDTYNLGHLIFGEDWDMICKDMDRDCSCDGDDPLSQFFLEDVDIVPPATWLKPGVYLPLFPDISRQGQRWVETHYYRVNDNYDVWSAIPAFPKSSEPDQLIPYKTRAKRDFIEYSDEDRMRNLVKNKIMTTKLFTVGPWEYCGVARLVKANGPKKNMYITFVCKNDPRIAPFYHQRAEQGEATLGLYAKGRRRKSLWEEKGIKLPKIKKQSLGDAHSASGSLCDVADKENAPPPKKKPRHSADQDLINGLF